MYTNNFLALRVSSSEKFLERAGRARCELWNAMLGKTEAANLLVFESKPITIAGHQGTEYSIDMATAVGGPAIPEIKASMEKLFGPGGKFRCSSSTIDDHTVLLAAATEAQVAKVIDVMATAHGDAGDRTDGAARAGQAARRRRAEWQLFVSPHGYTEWLRRQMDAISAR